MSSQIKVCIRIAGNEFSDSSQVDQDINAFNFVSVSKYKIPWVHDRQINNCYSLQNISMRLEPLELFSRR